MATGPTIAQVLGARFEDVAGRALALKAELAELAERHGLCAELAALLDED